MSKSSLCSNPARTELWSTSSGKGPLQKLLSCWFLHLCSSLAAFCRFGFKPCAICMGDPQDPLCLPCDHIYCLGCIRQWLCPGQMFCPFCMQPVNNDFQIVPSDAVRSVSREKACESPCNPAEPDILIFALMSLGQCPCQPTRPVQEAVQRLLH